MYSLYCRLGVHVGASPRMVIRATMARLRRPLLRAHRARRKVIYKAMLREHRDARALYGLATGAIP